MKKKILATSTHAGGIIAIIPVINKLNDDKRLDIITLGHQVSEKILKQRNMNYKTIRDLGLENISVYSMGYLLDKEKPDLVLTGTSVQDDSNKEIVEQTLTLAAKERKIPVIAVLDYWAHYSQRFSDVYTGEKHKFLPDRIAIMDEHAEKEMAAEGFDKNMLVITGNPNFDKLEAKAKSFANEERQNLRAQLGASGKLLYYATACAINEKPAFGHWCLDNIQIINQVFNELPNNDARMIVGLRPSYQKEDIDEISKYLQENAGGKIAMTSEISALELALAADITMTSNSTVAIEAMYMGKPSISLQPNLKCDDGLSRFTKIGIIPVGYTPEDCKRLVKRAISDEEFIKDLASKTSLYKTDGKATERVLNLVYGTLN
jgi:UDP-N-acetylglucosamine 2-epimerase